MQRMGIDDEAAQRFLRTDPAAKDFVRIAPGRFVQAEIDASGRLSWLRAFSGGDETAANASTRVRPCSATSSRRPVSASQHRSAGDLERRVELRSGEVQVFAVCSGRRRRHPRLDRAAA